MGLIPWAAAGLLALALGARLPPSPGPRVLFAQAKAALGGLPPALAPEYLDYIAHRELAAGEPEAAGDLRAAFALARLQTLSAAAQAKASVEYDVVDTLLAAGQAVAWQLAAQADAGRESIYDRVIPAALAKGDAPEAWALWRGYDPARDGFPFRAASALACVQEGSDAEKEVLAAGEAAAGSARDLDTAERVLDFVQACHSTRGAIALWRAMAAAPSGNWEVISLRQRVAGLVRTLDPGALAQLTTRPATGPPPVLSQRAAPAAARQSGTAPERPPAPPQFGVPAVSPVVTTELYEFESEAAASALYSFSSDVPQGPPPALNAIYPPAATGTAGEAAIKMAQSKLRQHPEFARYDPVGMAQLAVGSFQVRQPRQSAAFADAALAEAARRAVLATPETISFGNSPILQVFGLIAHVDLAKAVAQAEKIAPLMRPLALAEVARVAAAPPSPPGQHVLVLH